jgi:hypothetical protein
MSGIELTIVYKTYRNDLRWLKYSLASLEKFFKHPYKLLIYCHDECLPELERMLAEAHAVARVIAVEYDIHGYLKQQVVKAMCWQDVDTEYVMLMDSDIILKNPMDCQYFMSGDKIKWYYLVRKPESESSIHWPVWEEAVYKMTGEPMNHYYMHCAFPFLFKTKTLEDASKKFTDLHGVGYNQYCEAGQKHLGIAISDPIAGVNGMFSLLSKIFTEFEFIGWYCKNFSNDFDFIEGDNHDAAEARVQFWSHGGIESYEDFLKQVFYGQEG